jgi:hypothetical protein
LWDQVLSDADTTAKAQRFLVDVFASHVVRQGLLDLLNATVQSPQTLANIQVGGQRGRPPSVLSSYYVLQTAIWKRCVCQASVLDILQRPDTRDQLKQLVVFALRDSTTQIALSRLLTNLLRDRDVQLQLFEALKAILKDPSVLNAATEAVTDILQQVRLVDVVDAVKRRHYHVVGGVVRSCCKTRS